MLYRILLICIAVIGVSGCFWDDFEKSSSSSSSAPETNRNETLPSSGLLDEGNLESATFEDTGWSGYANAGEAMFELSDQQFYTGQQSLKATVTTVGANPWDIAVGPVGVPVMETYVYTYSVWILGTPDAVVNVQAQLEVDPWTTFASQQVTLTSSWQQVKLSFTIPEGVTSIQMPTQLSFEGNDGAEVYFDLASLSGKEPPEPDGIIIDIDIPLDSGWSNDGKPTTLAYDATSESLLVTPDWSDATQIAMNVLEQPMNFNGVALKYVFDVPQEYIDAEATLVTFVQQNGGAYGGSWVPVADTLVAGENTITFTPGGAPEDIGRVGFQIQGGTVVSGPNSALSLKRLYYQVEGTPSSDIPLDAGWSSNSGSDPVYGDNGVTYSPTAEDHNLTTLIDGPDDLEGATLVFSIMADQAFLDSGANLQPYVQQQFDTYAGEWSCWINGTDLALEANEFSCTLDEDTGAPFNIDDGQSLLVAIQAKGAPAGSITVTDIQIVYPSLPVDAGWRASTDELFTVGRGS